MDDLEDYLPLIQAENQRQLSRLQTRPPSTNPFLLPDQSEVFGERELEKRRRSVARERMFRSSLAERADMQRPPVPPLSVHARRGARTASALPGAGCGCGGRERAGRITEFVHEKREMYLLQMIIDRQRNEIAKIQRDMRATESGLVDQESGIGEMARRYKGARTQNEQVLRRVLRRVEVAMQRRVDFQRELKRAAASVATTKSEITTNEDLLDDYRVYRRFLAGLTPDDHNTHEFFNEPSKLTDILNFLERGNLILIQACHFYGEKVDDADRHFDAEFERCDELRAIVEEHHRKLALVQALPDAPNDATLTAGARWDLEYERLGEKIERTHRNCFNMRSDMAPLRMLEKIETRFEEFYAKLDQIKPEFIAMKQAQRDKLRREKQRTDKQIAQEAEQKIKIEQAMYRATRPIQKRTGRPLIPRTMPMTHHPTEDKAAIAAMREQQRIEALLYSDSVE
jgi:hypothetical protein